ncbi:uncharacterized protein LOC120419798 [Culex pipiens pallens]|uniref:uncharacterized protein LOC120419798 n=1 Tax=Culex pipiens pallens TaxID=42434 RepID=UPI001952EDE8|nr:uncharacterized protein LOC120419798 [Culex pipiens pallens]
MKFSTTATFFAVALCVASFAEAKPTFITKKILKKYVVPRVLSGEWKLPSLYIPYPLSLWLAGAETASPPVYQSLPEDEVLIDNSAPVEIPNSKEFNAVQPVPQQQQQLPIEMNVRGPVYIAETPAVRHIAPLPQGYTEDVHIQNVQPAPGTVA